MSSRYPIFSFKNESVVLLPGSYFTKNVLKSRLHEMNINASNIDNKNQLASLYDSVLEDNRYKLKIFDILKNDTLKIYSKSGAGVSERKSLISSNTNSVPNNPKNKVLNLSNEINSFNDNNSRVQEINFKKPVNSNTGNNTNDTFISRNRNQNQKNVDNSLGNSDQIRNNNNYTFSNNYSYSNSGNFQNLNQNSINNANNNKQLNNNINNNSNQVSVQQTYDNFMNNNTNIRHNNIKNNNNSLLRNGNNNNYSMNDNYSNQIQSNQINPILKNNNMMEIEDSRQNNLLNEQNQISKNNQRYRRKPDQESRFSFFSDFKNTNLYKNRKQICFNILFAFLILCFVVGTLYSINKYSDSISEFFRRLFNEPGRIAEASYGFISSLLWGSINYFYINILLIILFFFMIRYYKKYSFEKRCKEILQNIFRHLINNQSKGEENIIYEDEIYTRYVKIYGISHDEFIYKYIKILREMRRNEPRLKLHAQEIKGKKPVFYWSLDN